MLPFMTASRTVLFCFEITVIFHNVTAVVNNVFSDARGESLISHGHGICKSSQERTNFCFSAVSEGSELYIPYDSSAYSTTGSLSECCEDRFTCSAHNICLSCSELQTNINSTSACLSSMKCLKQNQQQNLPVASMTASQSSLLLSTLTLQSPREPCADHLVCDTRISEMHTTASSSTVTVRYLIAIVDLIFCLLHCMPEV